MTLETELTGNITRTTARALPLPNLLQLHLDAKMTFEVRETLKWEVLLWQQGQLWVLRETHKPQRKVREQKSEFCVATQTRPKSSVENHV
uniref:hypothetical protein n=1 Tax=Paenibacillus dendritiformis TaxID=130049 RepID=UPI00387E02DE